MLRKIRHTSRELGWGDTLYYMLYRLLGFCGRGVGLARYALVAQPVPDKPWLPGRRGAAIVVREVAPGDPALDAMPLSPAVLAYRWGQGAVCLGAFQEERMIGCLWFCLEAYEEDEVRCCFVPQPAAATAWDFDVYLQPEHRLGFGFLRLWDAGNAYLRDRGIAWSCSRISVFNRASVLAHRRMGARELGTVTFLKLGCFQVMAASLAPYLHLSYSKRPRLRLPTPAA